MSAGPIVLRGVRVHNLKSIDLDIPRQKLIVLCGLSGSGKSSLALDTLYAEGQRRYIESFSAYTRQFLQRLEKPDAELIDNIPPAIAVTSKNAGQSSRSTVGTATETADYLRLLFAKIGRIHCRRCGEEVRCDGPQSVAERIAALPPGTHCMIAFAVDPAVGSDMAAVLAALREEGFVRAIVDGRMVDIDGAGRDAAGADRDEGNPPASPPLPSGEGRGEGTPSTTPPSTFSNGRIYVVLDRLVAGSVAEDRLRDSLETAFSKGEGRCFIFVEVGEGEGENGGEGNVDGGFPSPRPSPEGRGGPDGGVPLRRGLLPAGKGGRLPSTAGRGGDLVSVRD